MKSSGLWDLTLEELMEREKQFTEEQYNLRFQRVTGQLENTGRLREVRKDLARVKTIMKEKSRAEIPAGQPE